MSITIAKGATFVDGDNEAQIFNVKDYGATGDGETNDSPAFLRAIAAANGAPVYIPEGNYLMGTTLTVTTDLYMYGPGVILQKYNVGAFVFAPTWGAQYNVTAQGNLIYPLAAGGLDDYVTRLTVDPTALASGEYEVDGTFKIWSQDLYPYVAAMTAAQQNWLGETVKILDIDFINSYIYCDRQLEDTYTTNPRIRSLPKKKLFLDVRGDTYEPAGYPSLPVAVSSLTSVGTLATLTLPANTIDVATGTVLGISGASDAFYNGSFTVTRVSGTVYTFTMTGTPGASPAVAEFGGIYAGIGGRQDMFLITGSQNAEVKVLAYHSWRAILGFRSGYCNKYDAITENQVDFPGAAGFGYGVYVDSAEYGTKGDVYASRTRHAFTTNIQKATTFSDSNYTRHGVPLRCGVTNGYAIGGIGADWDTHEGARYTEFDNITSESCRRGITGTITGAGVQNRGESTKYGIVSIRGSARGFKDVSQAYPFGRKSTTTVDTLILEDIDTVGLQIDTGAFTTTGVNQPQFVIDNFNIQNVGNNASIPGSIATVDTNGQLTIRNATFDTFRAGIIMSNDITGNSYLTIDKALFTRFGTATTDEIIRGNNGSIINLGDVVFDYTDSTSTRDPIRIQTAAAIATVTVKSAHIVAAGSVPTNFLNLAVSSGGAAALTANLGRITSTNSALKLTATSSGNSNTITVNPMNLFPRERSFSADIGNSSTTFNTLEDEVIENYNTALSANRLVTLNRFLDTAGGSSPFNGAEEITYRSIAATGAFALGTCDSNDAAITNTVIAFSGTVVTVTTTSPHGFAINDLVRVTSSSTAMQGIHRVSSIVDTTNYTFSCAAPSGSTPGTSQKVLSRQFTPGLAKHMYNGTSWQPTGIVKPYGTVLMPALPPITADVTLDYKYGFVAVNATSGNRIITLPAASGYGDHVFTVKKTDASANTVTLSCSVNIDGATTAAIGTQYQSLTVISDNVQWWIM